MPELIVLRRVEQGKITLWKTKNQEAEKNIFIVYQNSIYLDMW